MLRISGVTIPTEKQAVIALTYIYGIGLTTSKEILKKAGIAENTLISKLTDDEEQKIRNIINNDYATEGDLLKVVQGNIKRVKDINCYRGLRHKAGLPTRGQRTRTNARTRKGKGVAVGGAQKKAASKT